jgi:hypothetical protein
MRLPSIRLRSLMILVLFSALILAAFIHLARIDPLDLVDLKLRLFVLMPFFLLIIAKLGLVLGSRARRLRSAAPTDRPSGEGPRREESLS